MIHDLLLISCDHCLLAESFTQYFDGISKFWVLLFNDSLCCTNFMGHMAKYYFFCDWMNKTSYIRKKQTPLVNEVLLAQHLEDYSFILKIHATFPHKGCHILGSGPNSIKHNLGIKATEYRSSSSKTSTDQILKKYIFSHFY